VDCQCLAKSLVNDPPCDCRSWSKRLSCSTSGKSQGIRKRTVTFKSPTTRRLSGRVWRKEPDDILRYLGVGLHLSARVFRHHCFGVVSWRFPATSWKAHSCLSPNHLHEIFNLFCDSGPVRTEVLLEANSAKERDDEAGERIIIVTSSTRRS
jgi:hypothetical protein